MTNDGEVKKWSMLETDKEYLGDYLSKKLKEYPKIIANSVSKIGQKIKPNEVFIITKLLEKYKLKVSTYHKGILSPTTREFETAHTFAKVKEGAAGFSTLTDYPGINKRSIQIAIDLAEKDARSELSNFIGEEGQVREIYLRNDDYKFDISMNNEIRSDYDIQTVNMDDLSKHLIELAKSIKEKSKGEIKIVYADLASELDVTLMGNSGGALIYQKIPRTTLNFTTVAFPKRIVDTLRFTGTKSFSFGAATGLDMFYDFLDGKHINRDDFLQNIVDESIGFFYKSIPIEKTPYKPYSSVNAIFHPHAAGIFVHEALGHHIEQDLEDESYGARFLRDHIGDIVSSDYISIAFNPTYNKNQLYRPFGTYFYDDECVKGRNTPIITKGMAINTLNNLYHSKVYGVQPNGHCLLDFIRMSNLIIDDKPGINAEQLFEDIRGDGFYIKHVHGGYTSEITKQARVFVDSMYFINKECELIPIATLTPPASGKRRGSAIIAFNLSIDSTDILHKVIAIGKNKPVYGDPTWMNILCKGHCGKEGELTPTAEGGAYLLMSDLLITKNELDAPRRNLFFKKNDNDGGIKNEKNKK